MSSIKNILFPVDFSGAAGAALPYIVDLANRLQATLNFLHVADGDKDPEKLLPHRAAQLAAFAARAPGGTYCPQTVAYGKPAQAILRHAKAENTDIVAMPARGNRNSLRWMLGSVTEDILRQASCAVWIESENGHPHTRWSPILCAVDLDRESEQVVSYASELAEQFHANLIVVHAVPPVTAGSRWRPFHPASAVSESEARRKLKELLQGLNISAEFVAETGSVEDVISLVAERTRAELLVIGRGGQIEWQDSLGMHTYELIVSAPCPVVSCPRRAVPAACFWTEWQLETSERQADFRLISGVTRS